MDYVKIFFYPSASNLYFQFYFINFRTKLREIQRSSHIKLGGKSVMINGAGTNKQSNRQINRDYFVSKILGYEG